MGLFCVSFHFRTTDEQAITASLTKRGVSNYRVLPAKNGWMSLYEEQASQQDDKRVRELAQGLSKDLKVPAIAFMVHDSDIACYWLCDKGKLLDEFNSCPDYFEGDGDEPSGPSGGRPEVLLRYARAGVAQSELAEILAEENVFADNLVERLAEALGIDAERALADYRHIADGEGPGDDGDDDDDDSPRGGPPDALAHQSALLAYRAAMFGAAGIDEKADPEATALVQAASDDNVDEIDRLIAAKVSVDADGKGSLPGRISMGQVFPSGMPKLAMTPLLAAVLHKRRTATERLLAAGADPSRAHPLFGSAVHVACGAGDADLLPLLIDHGGDITARNSQGQTPLDVIAAGRATGERMAQAQAMMKSMGMKLPGALDQLTAVTLPLEGWDACERVLKSKMGQ